MEALGTAPQPHALVRAALLHCCGGRVFTSDIERRAAEWENCAEADSLMTTSAVRVGVGTHFASKAPVVVGVVLSFARWWRGRWRWRE